MGKWAEFKAWPCQSEESLISSDCHHSTNLAVITEALQLAHIWSDGQFSKGKKSVAPTYIHHPSVGMTYTNYIVFVTVQPNFETSGIYFIASFHIHMLEAVLNVPCLKCSFTSWQQDFWWVLMNCINAIKLEPPIGVASTCKYKYIFDSPVKWGLINQLRGKKCSIGCHITDPFMVKLTSALNMWYFICSFTLHQWALEMIPPSFHRPTSHQVFFWWIIKHHNVNLLLAND